MKKVFIAVMLTASLLAITKTHAQEDKLGAWYIYNGFFKFTPKIEFFFETQLRNYEVFSNPETYFFRPYFTYNVTKQFQLGVSTEYHKQFSYAENPEDIIEKEEFRIDFMAILSQPMGRVAIQHRYRYEFRNINTTGGNRMRYRLQVTVPINNDSFEKGTFFFNTNNEIFIDNKPEWLFDQNRLFGALGYYFTNGMNLQLGYLLVSKSEGNYNRLQIFFTQKLDFSKK